VVEGVDKMIVRARPLKKLCEFEGGPLPAKGHKPDCYLDLDETDYACKEKHRIMVSYQLSNIQSSFKCYLL
jgi:ATP-dependent DNA helicase 2 subunit 2